MTGRTRTLNQPEDPVVVTGSLYLREDHVGRRGDQGAEKALRRSASETSRTCLGYMYDTC